MMEWIGGTRRERVVQMGTPFFLPSIRLEAGMQSLPGSWLCCFPRETLFVLG